MSAAGSPSALTDQQVLHVAALARLQLAPDQVPLLRVQLASIISHIAKLQELDLSSVAPLDHPLDLSNRLDHDMPQPQLPPDHFLARAPLTLGNLIAVPKVLADGSSA